MALKKIPKPLTLAECLAKIQPTRFLHLLQLVNAPTYNKEYLHWEELRFKKPLPDTLSAEEVWCGLKLQRGVRRHEVALRDINGRPFSFLLCDYLYKELREIDLNVSGQIFAEKLSINTTGEKNRYLISTLIQEAVTSSQLEGAATTRVVADEMIRSNRAPRDDSERMILNNYRAMQFIREIKNRPLTMDLLKTIQARLTPGTLKNPDAAGRFRNSGERVEVVDSVDENLIYHTPPPADELERRTQAMLDFANMPEAGDGFVHPVLHAMILHFWLAYNHPFVDGNGRTARALFYWSMLRQGYWIFEYISISDAILKAPVQYARAFLETESDENDLNYFLFHQMKAVKSSLSALQEYVRRKQEETRRVAALAKNAPVLNYRQQALAAHAARHPGFVYTIEGHLNSHRITPPTAKRDLAGLVDKKILRVKKTGKVYYFTADADVEEKLRRPGKTG